MDNDSKGRTRWLCKCDCGTEKIIPAYKLLNCRVLSCGCLRKNIDKYFLIKQENKALRDALEEIREYSKEQVEHYETAEFIEPMLDWQDVIDKIEEVLNA